jgi:glyceraldehyde-3-phosphate dehydrogenase (NAD(P))
LAIKVLVNGIGTIGKRVAHAVKLQDDMKLVGIADVAPTSWLRTVLEPKGPLYKTDLYASNQEGMKALTEGGMYVKGLLEDFLASGEVDVVCDCTPAKIGEKNKPMYQKYGVKMVFQGGERAEVADVSFVAIANYEKAFEKSSVRVVSCNTTSLARTIFTIDQKFGVEEVFAALVRRATDPWDEKSGPINAVVPETHVPSHQGPDLQTVLPNINIKTMAVKVPSTLAHLHMITGKLKRQVSTEEFKKAFAEGSRMILLKASHGYSATSEVIERFRDLCRSRYDMYEVAIWDESVTVEEKRFYWMHAVHSEAIVIPETIDAIRAITGIEKDKFKSIEKTNKSLGIEK